MYFLLREYMHDQSDLNLAYAFTYIIVPRLSYRKDRAHTYTFTSDYALAFHNGLMNEPNQDSNKDNLVLKS